MLIESPATAEKGLFISLDLETLDTKPTAFIVAVGAVLVGLSGAVHARFYAEVSLGSPAPRGATISPSTVAWWVGQGSDARRLFTNHRDKNHLSEVLAAFSAWFANCKVYGGDNMEVLGNGPTFDNAILRHAFESHGIPTPWPFWLDRDLRTLVSLWQLVGDGKWLEFEGIKHHALDDAAHQGQLAAMILRAVSKKMQPPALEHKG